MGTLIAYLLLALAGLAVIASVNNVVEHHYVDPVIAKYEAQLKLVEDRAIAAEKANETLAASIEPRIAACNARADEFLDRSKQAGANAAEAMEKTALIGRALQTALKALRSKAAGPPTVGDACAQADAILSDLATDVRAALGLVTINGLRRTTGDEK